MQLPSFARSAGLFGLLVSIGLCGCAASPGASGSSAQEPVPTVSMAGSDTSAPAANPTGLTPSKAVEQSVTYDAGPAGWTKHGPEGDTLLQLSGPPGGPLGLSVTRAPAMADDAAFAAWIKAYFQKTMNQAVEVGAPTKATLGGASVLAYSFISGSSMARTEWCFALYPVADPNAGSVVVVADVGAGSKPAASCASVSADPSIAPVWKSLKITPR